MLLKPLMCVSSIQPYQIKPLSRCPKSYAVHFVSFLAKSIIPGWIQILRSVSVSIRRVTGTINATGLAGVARLQIISTLLVVVVVSG
jgi:hypothetical protein